MVLYIFRKYDIIIEFLYEFHRKLEQGHLGRLAPENWDAKELEWAQADCLVTLGLISQPILVFKRAFLPARWSSRSSKSLHDVFSPWHQAKEQYKYPPRDHIKKDLVLWIHLGLAIPLPPQVKNIDGIGSLSCKLKGTARRCRNTLARPINLGVLGPWGFSPPIILVFSLVILQSLPTSIVHQDEYDHVVKFCLSLGSKGHLDM